MRLLIADSGLPARRHQPVPFLGEVGEVVLPAHSEELGWHFAGTRSSFPCGSAATVAELQTTAATLGQRIADEAPGLTPAEAATRVLLAVAWVQTLPPGTTVTISPSGVERVPPQPQLDPQWVRADAIRSGWVDQTREERLLPLLVLDRAMCWRLVGIPVPKNMVFATPEALLAFVRTFAGFRTARGVEPFEATPKRATRRGHRTDPS